MVLIKILVNLFLEFLATNLYLCLCFFLTFLANYDPAEDEYYTKNGHVLTSEASASSNEPIINQPTSRLQRNISVNR